ncbi:MAG: c-type cytochrome [Proteobacteria bacterium]|nr:c-type cytochrome [Pseudomonadota bacterium]
MISGIFRLKALALLLILPQIAFSASPEAGEKSFQKCIACHTIGSGPLAGPDLKGVTARRDNAWLVRWIVEPDKMLAEGDAIATKLLGEFNNIPMPPMGITKAEAEDILAYIGKASGGESATPAPAPETSPVAPPVQGDAEIGKNLFLGRQSLANGAPACITCHANTDVGSMGGGTLGPDLTKVHSRYGGDVGLNSVLLTTPFPTMRGIFSEQPISETEVAHFIAYFTKTNELEEETVNTAFLIKGIGIGLLGLILVYILISLIWIKRFKGVRIPMVGK